MEPIIYAHFEEATNAAKNIAIQTKKAAIVKRLDSGGSVTASQPPGQVPSQVLPPHKPKIIVPHITPPVVDIWKTPAYRPPDKDFSETYDEPEDTPQSDYIYDDEEIDAKDVADREQDYWDEIGDDRDNSARSSNDGWYHPEGEGSDIDNCAGE